MPVDVHRGRRRTHPDDRSGACRRRLKTITIEPLVGSSRKDGDLVLNARFLGIGLSIFLSLASVGLFFKPGLNYGIDFKGGIQVEITTSQPANLAQLRSTLGGSASAKYLSRSAATTTC